MAKLPSYIDYKAPQYVRGAKPIPKPGLPIKLSAGTAKVKLNPAGKAFLAARSGHPGFKGNLTPAAARAAVTKVITTRPATATYAKGSTKTGARGGGGKKAVADPMTRMTNRLIASLLTPAASAKQARSGVDAEIAEALAGIRQSTAAEQAQYRHQADRAQQYAMALGSLRDMSGLQIGADYTNAAKNIQGLGTGLTGTIADAQQAEANQAAQQIAAATQGLGEAKGLDVEGMKNIAQYTGVTMPSTTLFGQAASHAAQARLDQDVRAKQVQNLAMDYLQKGTESQADLNRQVAALQAQRPSLYTKALNAQQEGQRSDVATIISALALQNQTAKVPSEINKTNAEAGAATTKAGATVTTANTGVAKVKGVDDKGNLTGGFYFGGPGKTLPTAIPKNWRLYSEGKGAEKTHLLVPSGDFYWAGAGHTNPRPIPKNMIRDDKDPTGHTLKANPNAFAPATVKPPGGETKAQKNRRIQGLVTKWQATIDKAMDAEGSPYAEDIQNPVLEAKAGYKPIWVPKKGMTYAKAKADIIKRLPPELRANPQMLANIDTSLKRVGFKLPGKAKPKGKGKITATAGGGTVPFGPGLGGAGIPGRG